MDLRTGHAFWPIRNGLLTTYPRQTRDERTDIAIVGAGISGALMAYELTAAGADVVVVDKRDVMTGSSAATTGLLLYETDSTLTELVTHVGEPAAVRAWRLGREAIDRIESLCRTFEDDAGFARRPTLYLASHKRDVAVLQREHALRRVHGFDVDWLDRDDVRARDGIIAPAALYRLGGSLSDLGNGAAVSLRAAPESAAAGEEDEVPDRARARLVS